MPAEAVYEGMKLKNQQSGAASREQDSPCPALAGCSEKAI
jgi:hypothetical protein